MRQVEKFQIPVKTSQNTFYQQFQNVDPETSINEKEKKVSSSVHLVTEPRK